MCQFSVDYNDNNNVNDEDCDHYSSASLSSLHKLTKGHLKYGLFISDESYSYKSITFINLSISSPSILGQVSISLLEIYDMVDRDSFIHAI